MFSPFFPIASIGFIVLMFFTYRPTNVLRNGGSGSGDGGLTMAGGEWDDYSAPASSSSSILKVA
jgi:hypothetical protein